MFVSQGTFTHWMDGSSLENMDWNNKSLSYQWPNTIALLTQHTSPDLIKINEAITSILRLFNIPKQPEADLQNNCTGVFTFTGCRARGWATISCKYKFYTSFICLSRSTIQMDQGIDNIWISGNITCQKDWLFIGGKCLTFLQSSHIFTSFQHAHSACEVKGGRLLSITQIPKPKQTKLRILKITAHLQTYDMTQVSTQNYTLKENSIRMSGIPFVFDSIYPELSHVLPLLEMLPSMSVAPPLILPVFEILSSTCWMLELGYLQAVPSYEAHDMYFNKPVYWGLKAIECRNNVDATAFVCERLPFKLYMRCLTGYFTCEDNTCILSVYVCDALDDCLKGEDERGCPEKNYATEYVSDINLTVDSMIVCLKIQNYTTNQDLVKYDNVHSLCDGLHTCNIVNEQLCSYRRFNTIQISHHYFFPVEKDVPIGEIQLLEATNLPKTNDPNDKTLQMAKRNKSFSLPQISFKDSFTHLQIQTNQSITFHELLLLCHETETSYSVYDYCMIHSKYHCTPGKYSDICRPVVCPGMFKCRQYACIRLSSICDGQADCPLSEDESNCFNISCPGAIKCRNENRCIGREQICNGISDCIYSSDDEVMCNICIKGCKCTGYTMQCSKIQANLYKLEETNHAKSIILNGHIKRLFLEGSIGINIIYLDVSLCNIHLVLSPNSNKNLQTTNIMFANFSNNHIKTDVFLQDYIFSKLVILDVGNNLLTFFLNRSLASLKHIQILKFDRNPIIYIKLTIFKNFPNLWMLNIEKIHVLQTIISSGEASLNSSLHIITDDTLFCCYFMSALKCLAPVVLKCHGFINYLSQSISIYMLTFLACIALLSSLFLYIYSLVSHDKINSLFFVLFNMGFSQILSCVYLWCILVVDWQKVNIVYWQTGHMCKILQQLLTLSLISSIILRCTALLILLFRITYPFKHQCRWLNYTWIICVSIWIMTILYAQFMSHGYLYSHSVFCTHWCQGADRLLPLKITMSIIELICIFSMIIFVTMTAMSLKTSMIARAHTKQNLHITFRVIFPLALEISTEAIFSFLSIYIIIYEFIYIFYINTFCMSIICFAMPIKIIISITVRRVQRICFRLFDYE